MTTLNMNRSSWASGSAVRALLLDRVLRRQHEQRPLEIEPHAVDGDLILLHGLEQRRLRLRRRPVDLVGEDDVREDGALDEPDDALPRGAILFDHLGAEDVGRHQVGRELNPVEAQIDGLGQLLDEERLGETRDAAKQAVAAGEKRDQDLPDDALLPDDGLRQLALEPPGHLGDALEGNRRCLRISETKGPIGHCDGSMGSVLRRGSLLAARSRRGSRLGQVRRPAHAGPNALRAVRFVQYPDPSRSREPRTLREQAADREKRAAV